MFTQNCRMYTRRCCLIGGAVFVCLILAACMGKDGCRSCRASGAEDATGNVFGRAFPGASITVENEATSEGTQGIADDDGVYRIAGLPPGVYTVYATWNDAENQSRTRLGIRVAAYSGSQVNFVGSPTSVELPPIH